MPDGGTSFSISTSPAANALVWLAGSGMKVTSILSSSGRPPYQPSQASMVKPDCEFIVSGSSLNGPQPTGLSRNSSLPIWSMTFFGTGVNARPGPRVQVVARNGANGVLKVSTNVVSSGASALATFLSLLACGEASAG